MKNTFKAILSYLFAIMLIAAIPIFCAMFPKAAVLAFVSLFMIFGVVAVYFAVLLLGEKINEKFFK